MGVYNYIPKSRKLYIVIVGNENKEMEILKSEKNIHSFA